MTGRLWVYKNSTRSDVGSSTGNWERFFAQKGPVTWGSTALIGRQNRAAAFEMQRGDQVLCWQSNRRAVIGLALLVDLFEFEDDDGAIQREFVLQSLKRFSPPIPIYEMRSSDPELAAVSVFKPGHVRTIYPTTPHEAEVLLRACGTSGVSQAAARRAQRANPESERAAIDFVTQKYQSKGWTVESREREKVGYDLHATKGRRHLHLEVKGAVGADPAFFLTANEYRRAGEDKRWRLCLLRLALDPDRRILQEWSGDQLLREATFEPASYRVQMSGEG